MTSPLSRLAAVALLLALGLGLAAGPQPCRAMTSRLAGPAAAPVIPAMMGAHPACHGPMSMPSTGPAAMPLGRGGASAAAGRGCCDHGATPGERLQCERSCALVAILTARPAAFAVGPLAAVAAAPAPRVAPLFAAAIEHIPL